VPLALVMTGVDAVALGSPLLVPDAEKVNVNEPAFAVEVVARAVANASPTNQNFFIIPPKFALAGHLFC
jgi:hypothetical protein